MTSQDDVQAEGSSSKLTMAHRAIARNAGFLISAGLLARALRVAYLLLLARLLGPELFGLLTYAQFWQLLFYTFVVFGTGRLISREIGRDSDQAGGILANSLSLRILSGVVVALVAGGAAWWLNPHPLERMLLLTFSLTLVARGLASWSQQVFTAYQASHLTLRQESIWRTAEAVLGLAAFALGAGLAGIAAAHALSWILQAVAGLRVVHRRLHPVALGWRYRDLAQLLTDGASAVLLSFSVMLMLQGGLILYRHIFPGAADVGQLAIVLQALGVLLMVPTTVAISALPALSRFAAGGSGLAVESIQTLLRLTLLGATAIALVGASMTAPLIDLVLGPDYADAGRWLGPALWLLLPFGVGYLLTQLLVAHGDYWANTRRALAAALIAVVVMPLAVAQLSGAGMLLAGGLSLTLWAVSLLWLVRKRYGLTLNPALRRAGGATAAAGCIWLVVALIAPAFGLFPSVSWVGDTRHHWIASAVGLAVLSLGLTASDWSWVGAYPRSRRGSRPRCG